MAQRSYAKRNGQLSSLQWKEWAAVLKTMVLADWETLWSDA